MLDISALNIYIKKAKKKEEVLPNFSYTQFYSLIFLPINVIRDILHFSYFINAIIVMFVLKTQQNMINVFAIRINVLKDETNIFYYSNNNTLKSSKT